MILILEIAVGVFVGLFVIPPVVSWLVTEDWRYIVWVVASAAVLAALAAVGFFILVALSAWINPASNGAVWLHRILN